MDWFIAYLVAGYVFCLGILAESLLNDRDDRCSIIAFTLTVVPLLYPYALYMLWIEGFYWNKNYTEARAKRDAQDLELYGC